MLKIPVQIADRTLPRVYVSVYDEQALADNKLAALIDDRRTAPRDVYDLELLLARGVVPSAGAVENLGGRATLMQRVADKLDLMSWSLFRDEVLPTLPSEIHPHMDEEEYLAMKRRLLETLEQCLAKTADDADPYENSSLVNPPGTRARASRARCACSIPLRSSRWQKMSARDISKPSVERWIQEAVAANRLQRVVRGLFLNRLIAPRPSFARPLFGCGREQ